MKSRILGKYISPFLHHEGSTAIRAEDSALWRYKVRGTGSWSIRCVRGIGCTAQRGHLLFKYVLLLKATAIAAAAL